MDSLFKRYRLNISEAEISKSVQSALQAKGKYENDLKKIFSLIDLTSLHETDTVEKIAKLCEKVNRFPEHFPDINGVAAVCVYPSLVRTVKENLKVDAGIASVTGGFPASQTFLSVKEAESSAAIESGATELDMVISVGRFLSEDYQFVFDEVKALKQVCGNLHLKVILETGSLKSAENIKKASVIALEAGADFLKTSTGKVKPAATLEAIYIMAEAIKEHEKLTGKRAGLKPAGGISDSKTALDYYTLVAETLGKAYTVPEYFRIGASSLANKLLSDITGKEVNYF